jgi:ABC-2 type transport system permease protein
MTHWRAVALIARWEFLRFFKVRELLVTIVFIVLGYTLGVPIFQALVGGGGGSVRVAVDASALDTDDVLRGVAELLVDAPEPLHPRFEFERGLAEEAEARVLAGDVDALLRAAPAGGLEVVVLDGVPGWLPELEGLLGSLAVPLRMSAEGVPAERVAAVLEPVALEVTALEAGPQRGGLAITTLVVVALVMAVFTGAGVLFTVITGEKTQRVTEAIVSAVSPQAWIDGKILGTSLFVLAYLVSYAIGIVLAVVVRGLFAGELPTLPSLVTDPAILLVTLVAAALGFGLWFTLFAAIAATVSDPTTSSRSQFIFLPGLALAVGFLGNAGNVDSALFRFFALFPFTSPSALPVRMMTTSVAAWEVLAALALLAGSVLLARSVAARVFALGIHMTGKEPSLAEVWRWVRQGGGTSRAMADAAPRSGR